MAVKKIDAMQTAQIIALQTDVGELRTKLNKAVTDALAISTILNILITDLNDLNDVVMKGYTPPASPESYGILEAIDIFQLGFDEHKGVQTYRNPYIHALWATHGDITTPQANGVGAMQVTSYIGHGLTGLCFGYNTNISFSPPAGGINNAPGNTGNNAPGSNLPPVLGGTDQGTNSSHSADAANAITKNEYDNRERLLEAPKAINRARKLVRNTLNKLRSK